MPELIYQRWIEIDPPEGCERTPPMATWVLPLRDGATLITLLYRPLTPPDSKPVGPRTRIALLTPTGDAEPWGPGQNYPAPIMFYMNRQHHIYGMDLTVPGKVYVCDIAGQHIATLEMHLRMESILAPQCLYEKEGRLYWINKAGKHMSGTIAGGGLSDHREEPGPPEKTGEVHFPHTHVCGDGCLYVLEHDPMSRVSKFRL